VEDVAGPPTPVPAGLAAEPPTTPGWQRRVQEWADVVKKFSIDPARYSEFEYLCFLDISDPLIENYVKFHLGKEKPIIYGRLASNIEFWKKLRSPEWLISLLEYGVRVPWAEKPPRFMLSNSKTVTENNVIPLVRDILLEYLELGFVKKVKTPPHCVLPLQLKIRVAKWHLFMT